MRIVIVGLLMAAAGALYPEPEAVGIGGTPIVRWTGGTLEDPDLVYLATRGERVYEISRASGAARLCKRLDFSKLDPCVGGKKLR